MEPQKPPVNQSIYQLKYHNQRYVANYIAQEICIKYSEEIRKDGDRMFLSRCLCTEKGAEKEDIIRHRFCRRNRKNPGIPVAANLVKRVQKDQSAEKAGSHRKEKRI